MLNKIYDKVELGLISLHNKLTRSERGDTNFISILIILGVVVALGGLFIKYGNDIIEQVEGTIEGFQFNIKGKG